MVCLTAACGSKGSPTTPSPTPPPVLPPLTLSFEREVIPAADLNSARLQVAQSEDFPAADMITLAVKANIGASRVGVSGIHAVEGELWWDAGVLVFDAWERGPFLTQGNVTASRQVATAIPGRISFTIARPSTSTPVIGFDDVFRVRLKPAAGMRVGFSRIQWDRPAMVVNNGTRSQLGFGGTITIQ